MRRFANILVCFISFLIIACNQKSEKKNTQSEFISVTKVVDGDTFLGDDGSAKGIKVRLIGIDAPESKNVFKKKIGYYCKESKAFLTQMLKGKKVKLVCDIDSLDRYGRTLAYVYLENGTFVNAEMIEQGYAMVMTVPPNVKFSKVFVGLQRLAISKKNGLWKLKTLEKQ